MLAQRIEILYGVTVHDLYKNTEYYVHVSYKSINVRFFCPSDLAVLMSVAKWRAEIDDELFIEE